VKILLVEDDNILADVLKPALNQQRYVVDHAADGQTGWQLAELGDYDLILLDVQLPKMDGITFCQRLRAAGKMTPVLLMTVQDSSLAKVAGLDAGADDYVVKPLDFDELFARIRALLRRSSPNQSPILTLGELQLNPQNCQVTYAGKQLSLTHKEYGMLELFLRHPHQVFSQSLLVDRLWSIDETPTENTVRAHIKALRQKLKQAGSEDIIETLYGLGYRLREPGESGEAPPWASGNRQALLHPPNQTLDLPGGGSQAMGNPAPDVMIL
jgi:DNA-binding response OmpR family regulator